MKASKTSRVIALLLDGIAISTIMVFLSRWLPEIELGRYNVAGQDIITRVDYSSIFIPIYFWMFDLLARGRTLGKMSMRIRTVSGADHQEPVLLSRLCRTLLKAISIAFWPISVLVFLIFDTTLEDKAINTITIRA